MGHGSGDPQDSLQDVMCKDFEHTLLLVLVLPQQCRLRAASPERFMIYLKGGGGLENEIVPFAVSSGHSGSYLLSFQYTLLKVY